MLSLLSKKKILFLRRAFFSSHLRRMFCNLALRIQTYQPAVPSPPYLRRTSRVAASTFLTPGRRSRLLHLTRCRSILTRGRRGKNLLPSAMSKLTLPFAALWRLTPWSSSSQDRGDRSSLISLLFMAMVAGLEIKEESLATDLLGALQISAPRIACCSCHRRTKSSPPFGQGSAASAAVAGGGRVEVGEALAATWLR